MGLDGPSLGCPQPWPCHGQGCSLRVTRLIWPPVNALGLHLGALEGTGLADSTAAGRCCRRLGHPSPCPPVHQCLRKWMTPTTSSFHSSVVFFFFQEHFPRGGAPGDVSVGVLRRETTFTEHLLCARYCAMRLTSIISFTPSNSLEG